MTAQWECLKDLTMDDGALAFIAGKKYVEAPNAIGFDPDVNLCLVDERAEQHWIDDEWRKNFKYISGDSMVIPRTPVGYECECGNYVSYEESEFGEAIFCNRCEDGCTMEPVYED
jgi:hypothetical protein